MAIATSIRRNIATICSGLYFFLTIFQLFSYQIFSHFTWYKIRRLRHHLKPRSRSGDDEEQNLITLCAECHEQVHRKATRCKARLQ